MTEQTKSITAEQAAVKKMADEAASAVNLSTADEMKAAIRQAVLGAFEAGKKATGWQPMETAPKDGTEVDLWVVVDVLGPPGSRRTLCHFSGGEWWGWEWREAWSYRKLTGTPIAWKPIEGPQDD